MVTWPSSLFKVYILNELHAYRILAPSTAWTNQTFTTPKTIARLAENQTRIGCYKNRRKGMVSESVELKRIVHIVVFVNYLTGHLLKNKSLYPLIFISWNLLTNLGHIVFNLWRLKHLYHLDISFACNFINILFVIAANIWTY